VEFTGARWRKSSFSDSNGDGECVEVAFLDGGQVALRDSKNPTRQPHVFTSHEWECFLAGVHAGEFERP
jgi:hypothetical protein